MKSSHIFGIGIAAVIAIAVLLTTTGSYYTVDQGEVAVVLRNGAVVDTAGPGFHAKMPWIEEVKTITTRQSKWTNDGANDAPGNMEAYSKDLQPAQLRVTVTYSVNPSAAADLYARYGDNASIENKIVVPAIYSAVKIVFGQYDAPTAIANRGQMVGQMKDAIQAALTTTDVHIDSFQLENVEFSKTFTDAVESRMQQEIAVQQFQQTLKQEQIKADIVRTQAKAQADAVEMDANAQAERTKVLGEAQADAIRARSAALKDSPGLIGLTAVEKWNGVLPATMVPGSTLPFLDMHQQPAQ